MWEMAEIRKAAIMILSGMFKLSSPMSQISLGREHGILSWIKEGFIILCLRPSPLRADEAVQLTKDDVIAYALAREEIRRRVLEQEGKRKEERLSTSRQIAFEENDMQPYGLMHWAHSGTWSLFHPCRLILSCFLKVVWSTGSLILHLDSKRKLRVTRIPMTSRRT